MLIAYSCFMIRFTVRPSSRDRTGRPYSHSQKSSHQCSHCFSKHGNNIRQESKSHPNFLQAYHTSVQNKQPGHHQNNYQTTTQDRTPRVQQVCPFEKCLRPHRLFASLMITVHSRTLTSVHGREAHSRKYKEGCNQPNADEIMLHNLRSQTYNLLRANQTINKTPMQ